MPRVTGRILTEARHDVVYVADAASGSNDREVLSLARQQGRILVTFDADFGDLVFQHAEPPPPAIVYVRLSRIDGVFAGQLVASALNDVFIDHLVVCTSRTRRRRRFPSRRDA